MINNIETLRSIITFNKLKSTKKNFVFFSENSTYTKVFFSVILNLIKKKIHVVYLTSDKLDFFYEFKSPYLKCFYISKVIGQIFLLNYIKCKNLILTMPDLGNFHIKRSLNCKNYIYLFHSPVSTNMIYRNRAFFNYDIIFCLGKHHFEELSEYKKKFSLNNLKLIKGGYPKVDDLFFNYKMFPEIVRDKVSIAPSWGKNTLINYNIESYIQTILDSNYKLNFRPHYQMKKLNIIKLNNIKEKFKSNSNFCLDENNEKFNSIFNSEFLITDWSGIGIEYAFVTERPVIYVNTNKKINNNKFNDLSICPIEISIRDKIGIVIEPNDMHKICKYIKIIKSNKDFFKKNIRKERKKYLYNFKTSAKKITEKILEFR